jgi:hypothetical protein
MMYQVVYNYYAYPARVKQFEEYAAAKAFFHAIRAQKGVRRAELIA